MQLPSQSKGEAQPQKKFIGVLYGFRALMVLIVCNYHIWQQSWLPQYFLIRGVRVNLDFLARSGYIFVDGMILLSGFLLFLPYAAERAGGAKVPPVKQFYFNRAVRILPSYLLAVGLALFLIALPQNRYPSTGLMVKDILTHLSFTFNFWKETFVYTPLNAALWTICVEVQFYLLFPLLARAVQKKPGLTLGIMGALGIAYRAAVYVKATDTTLLINQLPAFLDVYALGMLGAMAYVKCTDILKEAKAGGRALRALPWISGAIFALSLMVLTALLRAQAKASGFEGIRLSQLVLRLPFALTLLWAMLSASFMPRPLQKLLDNRLMRFLSAISLNLYIWHQTLSVQMRLNLFPDTLQQDRRLQWAYTLLCYSCSIVAAMLLTYGMEQPAAKLARYLQTHWRKKDHEGSQTLKA